MSAEDVRQASDFLYSIGEYSQVRASRLADLFAETREKTADRIRERICRCVENFARGMRLT